MLSASIQISDQDSRTVSSSQGGEYLGQIAGTSDGRTWAYGLNGTGSGTAIAAGLLTQGALSLTNHTNRTGVTATAGTNTVTFAVGATLVSSNQYLQGYLVVNAGTGAGQSLLISGNTSAASSGSPVVNLKDSIITATAASDSKFSLVPHPYSACVLSVAASSTAVFATGVPTVSQPDANYGWYQVGGASAVRSDASVAAVGQSVVVSATTNGDVTIDTSTNLNPKVGYALVAGVSAEYRQVFLTINNG